MKPVALLFGIVVLSTLASSGAALAEGDPPGGTAGAASPTGIHAKLQDLGLANFFSAGWDEDWSHHERYTPDMALLKVTTNFLEREFRLDYSQTGVRGSATVDTSQLVNGLIAYGLNRRFMLEVISNYQWNDLKGEVASNGGGGGAILRTQLVDTDTLSVDLQAKLAVPNKGISTTQTSVAYSVGAWQDLHALFPALGRMGLYESIQLESLQGPAKVGARTSDLAVDISLAKTWTSPTTPGLRNFTTFAELFFTKDLNGAVSGQTIASITPGIRTWFAKGNSITIGEDLPVGRRGSFYRVIRATYILNF